MRDEIGVKMIEFITIIRESKGKLEEFQTINFGNKLKYNISVENFSGKDRYIISSSESIDGYLFKDSSKIRKIIGLIGENGSGKTTFLSRIIEILNLETKTCRFIIGLSLYSNGEFAVYTNLCDDLYSEIVYNDNIVEVLDYDDYSYYLGNIDYKVIFHSCIVDGISHRYSGDRMINLSYSRNLIANDV